MTTTARAQGATVWLTGLPSAGKTTIARTLAAGCGPRATALRSSTATRSAASCRPGSASAARTATPMSSASGRSPRFSPATGCWRWCR
ncbi:adenylyl-sulfate kinase [Streptomyces cavernae]|uniref:adenylyl-sulfate kinase n=1 Tax=Streptomyces cavernae TaxID=2259034 RepID=UPI0023682789|nr:adenylyl-sulfate kinase [Streptomyces cavernae]